MYLHVAFKVMAPLLILPYFVLDFFMHLFDIVYCNEVPATTI
jgi:hypothetical protein